MLFSFSKTNPKTLALTWMILAVFLSDQSHSQGRSHFGRPSSPSPCRFSTILAMALNIGLMHSESFIFSIPHCVVLMMTSCMVHVICMCRNVHCQHSGDCFVKEQYDSMNAVFWRLFYASHVSWDFSSLRPSECIWDGVMSLLFTIAECRVIKTDHDIYGDGHYPGFKSGVCTYEFLKAIWSGATVPVNAKLTGLSSMMFLSVEVLSWNRLIFFSTRWSVEFFGYATEAFMVAFLLQ